MIRMNRRTFLALTASVVGGMSLEANAEQMAQPRRAFTPKPARPLGQTGMPEGVVRLDYTSGVDGTADWALILPPTRGSTWVVHIHGHGSHGDQIFTRPDISGRWLPKYRSLGLGVLGPNLRDNAWMSPAAASDLHDLLAYARSAYSARRFLFISGSMGGTSNLIYACLHPEDVAGVMALCPATDLTSYHAWCLGRESDTSKGIASAMEHSYGGAPRRKPEVYAAHSALKHADRLTMPVFVSHGTADDIIPVSQPRRLAGQMGDRASFAYVEVPDGGHDAPLHSTFDAGFEWLMRKTAP